MPKGPIHKRHGPKTCFFSVTSSAETCTRGPLLLALGMTFDRRLCLPRSGTKKEKNCQTSDSYSGRPQQECRVLCAFTPTTPKRPTHRRHRLFRLRPLFAHSLFIAVIIRNGACRAVKKDPSPQSSHERGLFLSALVIALLCCSA